MKKDWRTQQPKWGERQGKLHGFSWYEKWWLFEEFQPHPRTLDLWGRSWTRFHLSNCKGNLWNISPPISHMVFSHSRSKKVALFSLSLSIYLSSFFSLCGVRGSTEKTKVLGAKRYRRLVLYIGRKERPWNYITRHGHGVKNVSDFVALLGLCCNLRTHIRKCNVPNHIK